MIVGALGAVSSLSYAIVVENPPELKVEQVKMTENVSASQIIETSPKTDALLLSVSNAPNNVREIVAEPASEPKQIKVEDIPEPKVETTVNTTAVFDVPFFSQFTDISAPEWKKIGCGVTSLAMIIELYEPGETSVDSLLKEGIARGAYLNNAGWIHQGLVNLAKDHGLDGTTRDLSSMSMDSAFAALKESLTKSPVIASVHYTFEPTNPIPHLVVITGVDGDTVYYNDPSERSGGGSLSATKFKKSWKKRYIEIFPAT